MNVRFFVCDGFIMQVTRDGDGCVLSKVYLDLDAVSTDNEVSTCTEAALSQGAREFFATQL